jgi:alanine-glyoxylate transaminase / (R)-3-amino-2-methylpropionate-pyruvate transaminase
VPYNDLNAMELAIDNRTAAVLVEPIQGEGGVHVPDDHYLSGLRKLCDESGALLIFDEIQTGMGRTGRLWCYEHWGVEPDIMTMAKGVANGLPLGVTIATPEIAASLKALTISTFGGNPVSCAAANATIQIIEEEKLPDNAERMGRLLREGLEEIQRRFPKNVGEVRGMGLMQGVELVVDETAGDRTPEKALTNRVFEEARNRGLLIGKGGLEGNCFRIAPALTVTEGDVREALEILTDSFAASGAL